VAVLDSEQCLFMPVNIKTDIFSTKVCVSEYKNCSYSLQKLVFFAGSPLESPRMSPSQHFAFASVKR